jgi:hypothetical protein
MSSFLLIVGLVVLAFACRSFEHRYLAKLGWLVLLAASYLAGYSLSGGSHVAGMTFVLSWFLLPWIEIVSRVRKLRFPSTGTIEQRYPPSREVFPDLDSISAEVSAAGFAEQEDAGWQWDETEHFMRLCYHEALRAQATVNLAQQGEMAVSFVSVTSRAADGRTFTTSNYPFSTTMKLSPEQKVHRFETAQSFADLLAEHQSFLSSQSVTVSDLTPLNVEQLGHYIEQDMAMQIQHNVRVGVLTPSTAGDNTFRYTWRGCIYLWLQIVKDMIRV